MAVAGLGAGWEQGWCCSGEDPGARHPLHPTATLGASRAGTEPPPSPAQVVRQFAPPGTRKAEERGKSRGADLAFGMGLGGSNGRSAPAEAVPDRGWGAQGRGLLQPPPPQRCQSSGWEIVLTPAKAGGGGGGERAHVLGLITGGCGGCGEPGLPGRGGPARERPSQPPVFEAGDAAGGSEEWAGR